MQKHTLLLVEDSPAQAAFLTAILTEAGLDVVAVESTQKALQLLYSAKTSGPHFELVLTDIHLADGTGFDLCQTIRSDEQLKHLSVVLITGDLDPANVLRGLEVGAIGFIRKDSKPKDILSRILRTFNTISTRKPQAPNQFYNAVEFLGSTYQLNSNPQELINVLLSAFEDVVFLSEERLKIQNGLQKVNQELKTEILNRKQAEKKLSEQQTLMLHTSKMTALGEMAGGIAHEINNPLCIIRNNAELLKMTIEAQKVTPEALLSISETIETTVVRISKIIQALQSFCRDTPDNTFQVAKLKDILVNTNELCSEKFKTRGIQLIIAIPLDDQTIECRPTEISQVLLNLLNNAYDAVFDLREKWVKIEVIDYDHELHISVTDSGNGIPKETAEKMFQPFFTTKEFGKGTGLGLSISTGIIANHQGTIELKTADKNTCFVLKLPKYQKHNPRNIIK